MNRALKFILLGLLAGFVIIQFVGPSRPAASTENPDDMLTRFKVDSEIAGLIRTSCYDCHSMETEYPWYASVAPFSWRVYGHVEHGREDFSVWASLSRVKRVRKLKDIGEEVGDGEMPLKDYMMMHSDARLTDVQRQQIVDWADAYAREIMGK